MYGGKSIYGGRGGDSPYGGWTTISGTATSGTTIAYICGRSAGGQAFYDGGPGSVPIALDGGGFTAVWVGGSNIQPVARDSNYILGVAGVDLVLVVMMVIMIIVVVMVVEQMVETVQNHQIKI